MEGFRMEGFQKRFQRSPSPVSLVFLALCFFIVSPIFAGPIQEGPVQKGPAQEGLTQEVPTIQGQEEDQSSKAEPVTLAQLTEPTASSMEGSREVETNSDDSDENYETIVVLGVRSGSRTVENSTVPIDVFDNSDLSSVGGGDMGETLMSLIPSFGTSMAFDGSTFVKPMTIRGGAADQTLVMVNGKRRHRSSVLHLYSVPANRGAHGADVDMIPAIAVKNVEVLRDGAAAQYGSDAIAGVVNFALKDHSEGGSVEVNYGNHFEGEQNWRLSANVGASICNNGFLNLSIDTNETEHLSRGGQTQQLRLWRTRVLS